MEEVPVNFGLKCKPPKLCGAIRSKIENKAVDKKQHCVPLTCFVEPQDQVEYLMKLKAKAKKDLEELEESGGKANDNAVCVSALRRQANKQAHNRLKQLLNERRKKLGAIQFYKVPEADGEKCNKNLNLRKCDRNEINAGAEDCVVVTKGKLNKYCAKEGAVSISNFNTVKSRIY